MPTEGRTGGIHQPAAFRVLCVDSAGVAEKSLCRACAEPHTVQRMENQRGKPGDLHFKVFLLGDELVKLRSYGYLGVFLISVIGNATVILPVPSLAVVFAGGGVLNPLIVGLIAGVGEPLGELTGYLAGYGGSAVLENSERVERIKKKLSGKGGFATLFVLSAIPNPLFDLAGISAGVMHYPVGKFLLACWLGKTTKALVIAYLGSVSIHLLEPLFG